MPARVSPATYPIAAAATAPAYNFDEESQAEAAWQTNSTPPAQQPLFSGMTSDPHVIPFDSLAAQPTYNSFYSRPASSGISEATPIDQSRFGSGTFRPAPVPVKKVEVYRARRKKHYSADQQSLEFFGRDEVSSTPRSTLICDTPVAPATLRAKAGLIDFLLMGAGCAIAAVIFALCSGGGFSLDKHSAPFLMIALVTVPVAYRLLWAVAGLDSLGMRMTGLRLVDFDGNPPSQERRYHRILGSILSVMAAGMGVIWSLVDQDCLSWHDHISCTFPTVVSEG